MNLLKNTITRVMVALAAITLVVGCSDSNEEGGVEMPDLQLQLSVENITATTAKIKVSHSQDSDLTWYGFVSDRVGESVTTLAEEEVASGAYHNKLHRSKQYVEVLEELQPSTDYTYIAFGLTDEGKIYGEIVAAEFKTLSGNNNNDEPEEINGMRRNNAWTVRYIGAGTVEGKDYDHVVTVGSVDKNPYTVTIVYAEYYDPADLRGLADLMLEDMHAYLDEYNAYYGTSYTIAHMLSKGDDVYKFDLDPGLYRAVAMGYIEQGEVSGLYAVSDEFEVEMPVATKEFNEWLGKWSIEGMNKAKCNITLSAGTPNKSIYMTGWEGYEDLEVEVEYDKQLNSIFFYSQLVAEDYYISEKYPSVDIYFLAGEDDGNFYSIDEGLYYISIGGILDDGARMIVRYGVNTPEYPRFSQMFFMAYVAEESKYYGLSAEADVPSFLATMTPIESAAAQRMVTSYSRKEFKRPVLVPTTRKVSTKHLK